MPEGATVCVHVRTELGSHAAVQGDQLPAQLTFAGAAGQPPSPGTQSCAVGHADPVPDGATVCVHVRAGPFSQAAVQTDQLPWQFTFAGAAGHPPSPGAQFGAVLGHTVPVPEGATVWVHLRAGPCSHAAVQGDQLPAQLTLAGAAGHPPSPGAQFGAAGHGEPAPAGATVCVHVRAGPCSQAAVQADQLPAQLTGLVGSGTTMSQNSFSICGSHLALSNATLLTVVHVVHFAFLIVTATLFCAAVGRSLPHSRSNSLKQGVDFGSTAGGAAALVAFSTAVAMHFFFCATA